MLVRILAAWLLLALCVAAPGVTDDEKQPPKAVDLVLVLDTSASMEALIDAARDKLSRVITTIATADPEPDLRLALVTYGTPDVGADVLSGDVVLQSDLTFDFDAVFEHLDDIEEPFRGGHENVGSALFHTYHLLSWTRDSLRIVFVAGNESADQDRARRVAESVKQLAKQTVRVNAIYCGGAEDGLADSWREIARQGGGQFASIDHNQGTVTIASPFDEELASLSTRLTRSYLLAGAPQRVVDRIVAVDARVAALGLALSAERVTLKASALFRVPGLDLASAAVVRAQDLVRALAAKREAHVRARMKAEGLDDRLAFDRVVRDALRTQMGAAGYRFP